MSRPTLLAISHGPPNWHTLLDRVVPSTQHSRVVAMPQEIYLAIDIRSRKYRQSLAKREVGVVEMLVRGQVRL